MKDEYLSSKISKSTTLTSHEGTSRSKQDCTLPTPTKETSNIKYLQNYIEHSTSDKQIAFAT